MRLKTRYQYTYFINTFIVKENRYTNYILRLLRNPNFSLKIFEKNKNLEIYTGFLPKIREFLFGTFDLESKEKQAKLNDLPIETKAAILSKYPSLTFEYDMPKDIQGKTMDKNSIFFKIQKVGLVLFNTGICFLYLKTNIEDSQEFSDILNFNYKFRDINQEGNNLKNYENINVQTDSFENIETLKEFIANITGPNIEALKIDVDIERFYTYAYACIRQDNWNINSSFEEIKNDFYKYVNILPEDSSRNPVISDGSKVLANSKFSKIGVSKLGINLLASDCDLNNYTSLPIEFENLYFYTYILSLYLKIYLKKINYEFKENKDLDKTRKKFINFTKQIWIQEITSDDILSLYYTYIKDVLEIEKIYNDVKNKYNILFNELKIERNEKYSIIIIGVLILSLMFNIVNFIIYLK